MNKSHWKPRISSLIAGVLLGAGAVLAVAAVDRSGLEYKVVSGSVIHTETEGAVTLERTLNAAVSEGWLLVSVANASSDGRGFAVLKREKK